MENSLMRKSWFGATLMFLCGMVASECFAGDVTFYAGLQNPGKLTINNIPTDTKLGGVFGARISGGRLIGFEQTFGFSANFLESDQHAFNTQSNLILTVPTGQIAPYGTVGIGLITTYGDKLTDFGTKFTVNYGGGLKFRNLAGLIGLRFDVRGYSVPAVFSQTLNFVEGSIGLLLSW
jgi:hypothetical protein